MKIKKTKFSIKISRNTPKRVASKRVVYKRMVKRRKKFVYLSF